MVTEQRIVVLPAWQERKKIQSMQVYDILSEELHPLSFENKDPGEPINKIHINRENLNHGPNK